jgi:hypothetical protein
MLSTKLPENSLLWSAAASHLGKKYVISAMNFSRREIVFEGR